MAIHPSFERQDFVIPIINERPHNRVADHDGFHVSYNGSVRDYGCETTSIVLGGRVFLVLNGNHTHALNAAVIANGAQGCIDYFAENLSQSSSHSEHLMITGHQPDIFGLAATAREVVGQYGLDRLIGAVSNSGIEPISTAVAAVTDK